MKKIIFTIVTILILLLSLNSCDKYHRNKYVGDWEFVTRRSFFEGDNWVEHVEVKRDTIYYSGTISLGDFENEILIEYSENYEISAWIEKSGKEVLLYTNAGYMMNKYPSGEFYNLSSV